MPPPLELDHPALAGKDVASARLRLQPRAVPSSAGTSTMSCAVWVDGYHERVAQRLSLGAQGRDYRQASGVVCGALLLGAFMGYGSLAAGPLGMAAMVAAGVLC